MQKNTTKTPTSLTTPTKAKPEDNKEVDRAVTWGNAKYSVERSNGSG